MLACLLHCCRVKKIDLMYTVSSGAALFPACCHTRLLTVNAQHVPAADIPALSPIFRPPVTSPCTRPLALPLAAIATLHPPTLQVLVKSTGERCYFPNTRLITLPVVNLTRSCARSEKVVISLNIGAASNAAREALLVS